MGISINTNNLDKQMIYKLIILIIASAMPCVSCSGSVRSHEPAVWKPADIETTKQVEEQTKEKDELVLFYEYNPRSWARLQRSVRGKYLQIGDFSSPTIKPYLYLYRGEPEISWSVVNGIFRVNGRVVGLDLSEIETDEALKLIEKYGEQIKSVAWIGVQHFSNEIVAALAKHSNEKLAISLIDFNGPGANLLQLRPLKEKLDFVYYSSSSQKHKPEIKHLGFLNENTKVGLQVRNADRNFLKQLRVLKNLKRIEIGEVSANHYLPDALLRFPKLEVLLIRRLPFLTDMSWVRNLTNLRELQIWTTGKPSVDGDSLKELSDLQFLRIDNLEEKDSSLWWIENLKELRVLMFDCFRFKKKLDMKSYQAISRLPNLKYFDLSHCEIDEDIALQIGSMNKLEFLLLGQSKSVPVIKEKGLTQLKGLSRLQHFSLKEYDLSKKSIKSIPPVFGLVRSLFLGRCNIEDNHLKEIGSLGNLEMLYFWSENFTDKGVGYLKGMKSLKSLALGSPNVTDKGMKTIGRLKDLRYLNIDGTRVGDEGIRMISALPNLKVLNMRYTQVTDRGLIHLASMKSLQSLVLSKKYITQQGIDLFLKSNPNCTIYKD